MTEFEVALINGTIRELFKGTRDGVGRHPASEIGKNVVNEAYDLISCK
jgi:hypothetical protein